MSCLQVEITAKKNLGLIAAIFTNDSTAKTAVKK